MGASFTTVNQEIVDKANIIFLCVKPHLLLGVLDEISSAVKGNQLFISVAAGVTLTAMENKLPSGCHVVRTMPNTPCLVQSGVIVYSLGKCCTLEDGELIKTLLTATGIIEEVPESQIDSLSAIMG